jgi:hypothetical protein
MTKFIFHVGPHKTGSTYLQDSFCAFREELERRGVSYPVLWQTFLTGHHALARDLRQQDAEALRTGFESLRGKDIVVFSSEEFSSLDRPSLLLLRELIGPDVEVEFIFYTRRWSELLPSAWQEDVKQGSAETLPEFFLRRVCAPLASNIINFCVILDRLADVFGKSSIRVVSYSNLVDAKVDLFQHFLRELLKIDDQGFPYKPTSYPNVSLDPLDVELIRVLNRIQFETTGKRSAELRGQYMRRVRFLELDYLRQQMTAEQARVLIDDGAITFERVYHLIHERYGDRIVGNDKRIFAPGRGKHAIYIRPNYLCDEKVVGELFKLHQALSATAPTGS